MSKKDRKHQGKQQHSAKYQEVSHTENESQVQPLLLDYHNIAQRLRAANNPADVSLILEPITEMDEAVQLDFLMALRQEKNGDTADIAEALRAVSVDKEVRKEARRLLIRLESQGIYAEWTPPAAPRISDAVASLSHRPPLAGESDQEGSGLFADYENFLSSMSQIFAEPEYVETIIAFITNWVEGDYEQVYDILASQSPLRANLSKSDWVALREKWHQVAQPRNVQIIYVDLLDQEEPDDESDQTGSNQRKIDVSWSVEFAFLPADLKLPEIPTPSLIFSKTGRHWFRTTYTLNSEDGKWRINSMHDEVALAQTLSTFELETRTANIAEIADEYIEYIKEQEEEEEDEFSDYRREEVEEEVLGELEEGEEEEDESESVFDPEYLEESVKLISQGLYYNDVLLTRHPTDERYLQSAAHAQATEDYDRALVYLTHLVDHDSQQKITALHEIANNYVTMAQISLDNNAEEKYHLYMDQAEVALHDLVALEQTADSYVLLAKLLVQRDKFDEARPFLQEARNKTDNVDNHIDISIGLSMIAQEQKDFVEARDYLHSILAQNPDLPELLLTVGVVENKLGDYNQAIEHLRHAIQVMPDLVVAYVELSRSYLALKNLVEARQVLRQGLDWNGESVDLLAGLAIVYAHSGDLRSADKYLKQASKINPTHEAIVQAKNLLDEYRRLQPRKSTSPKKGKR